MTADDPQPNVELYEQLAAIQHDIWSHWMRYLLDHKTFPITTEPTGRGIREADAQHWQRQIATPYAELTEREKVSDREQVDRYWHLIRYEVDRLREAMGDAIHYLAISDGATRDMRRVQSDLLDALGVAEDESVDCTSPADVTRALRVLGVEIDS